LQPFSQRLGRPKLYDPKRSGGKVLRGHTWEIQYGDGSGFVSTFLQHALMAELSSANGQVYLDSVGVGSISYPNQAIGAASKVSTEFARDQGVDGLMGLAFSKINSAKPQIQLTWFDNVKSKLAAPVFTCALKRRQVSYFCFSSPMLLHTRI
jgi:aspergillopepsin I